MDEGEDESDRGVWGVPPTNREAIGSKRFLTRRVKKRFEGAMRGGALASRGRGAEGQNRPTLPPGGRFCLLNNPLVGVARARRENRRFRGFRGVG